MKIEVNKISTLVIIYALVGALVGAYIGLLIFTLVKYGNLPHDEIPTWVLWLWFNK